MDEPLSPDMPILHPKISQKIWIYWHSVIATQLLTTEGNRSMLKKFIELAGLCRPSLCHIGQADLIERLDLTWC